MNCVWQQESYTAPSKRKVDIDSVETAQKYIVRYRARPPMPKNCPKSLQKLIQMCWEEAPEQRPEFDLIVETLEENKNAIPLNDYPLKIDWLIDWLINASLHGRVVFDIGVYCHVLCECMYFEILSLSLSLSLSSLSPWYLLSIHCSDSQIFFVHILVCTYINEFSFLSFNLHLHWCVSNKGTRAHLSCPSAQMRFETSH